MWNDVFAEDRLLFLPPHTSALLVLFCRNHNFIAEKLLQINEKNRFTNPPPDDPSAMRSVPSLLNLVYSLLLSSRRYRAQDDEIFNVARLINAAHFANIVFSDYLAAILG
jgi:hypothetical protein